MNDNEYYELLGVDRNSDSTTIKKAYRKLALKYHPDKAPEDKKDEYEETFKKISEAYNVLSDPEKKNIYDRFGKDAVNGNGGPNINPFDIFNDIFGGGGGFEGGGFPPGVHVRMGGMGGPFSFHQNFSRKTRDTVIRLEVTLEEVFTGISKDVKFKRNIEGKNEDVNININIPSGCQDGIKMVKKEFGNKQKKHDQGDVVIVISHSDHKLFKLSENHIVMEKNISFGSSLIGVTFSVKHLSGEVITFSSDGLIEDGDLRVIKGKGIPHMRTDRLGDFIVKFNVEKNFTLSEKDKKVLKQIFPVDKFPIDSKGNVYQAVNPKELNDSDEEEREGPGVQCAQQ